jgi:hypothetical protein
MGQRKSPFHWFARCILLLFCCASALADASNAPLLSQEQLKDSQAVTKWLRKNRGKADTSRAEQFFKSGERAKRQGRWGPAGKAFAESAIRWPRPQALSEYADALLRARGEMRRKANTLHKHSREDLREAEHLYRSALAADGELGMLSAKEKEGLMANVACVSAYVQSGQAVKCAALDVYQSPR